MLLQISISDELAKKLEERASLDGTSAEQIALAAIQRELASSSLAESLLSVHRAYDESGLTEDESFELLEAEKHAMRRERRAASE